MTYILYGNGSAPSGRQLRRLLGLRGGTPPHFSRQTNIDALIRYGVSMGSDVPITLNRAEAVALAAHKGRALACLDEAGVRVPEYSHDPSELHGVILGRTNNGSGGTDIRVYRPDDVAPEAGAHPLFTQFVPSVREMRLHIFQGRMIHAQVKQYQGEGPESETPLRNHSRGYVFVPYVRTRPNRDRIDAAVRAVSALGLDFGAVDLLVGTDGRVYVLEVNTGAGLSPRTCLAYGEAIREWGEGLGIDLDLRPDVLELDAEEEACYTDSEGATSAEIQPSPEESVGEIAVEPEGQDRAERDEREALSTEVTRLRDELRAALNERDEAIIERNNLRSSVLNVQREVMGYGNLARV